MFKKIIVPTEELKYRIDGVENKYLYSDDDRSIGLFALNKGHILPVQIYLQKLCLYVLEGNVEVVLDDKVFNMKTGELILIPDKSEYRLVTLENSKLMVIRI